MNIPINKWLAAMYTILIFFAVGLINEYVALKIFGNIGALITAILGLFLIFKVWQLALAKSKKK